jgi:hypothetical protein
MADMANEVSRKPFIYDWLSFLDYDLDRPLLDTEWLLSTLFDASLLSTSKAAGNGGSFLGVLVTSLETIKTLAAGLSPAGAQ